MSEARVQHEVRHFTREALALRPDVAGAHYWAIALERTLLTYFVVDAQCAFPAHQHESEQITHVLEGELFFVVDGVELRVAAGEAIAIPSGVTHAVFTRDRAARAVDAWSPVLPAYRQPADTSTIPSISAGTAS